MSVYSIPPLCQVPGVPYEESRHSPDVIELTVLGKQTAKRSEKCREREVKCYSLPQRKRIKLGPEESTAGSRCLHVLIGKMGIMRMPASVFPGGPVAKNHLPMQGTQVRSLFREDSTCS